LPPSGKLFLSWLHSCLAGGEAGEAYNEAQKTNTPELLHNLLIILTVTIVNASLLPRTAYTGPFSV
jgi:hypothetical protein